MKFTKTRERQLREFMDAMDGNWCLPVTEWTGGTGRYTKSRALPPFVQRFGRKECAKADLPKHGTTERTAYDYLAANTRKKAVLVLDRDAMLDFLFEAANGKEC